MEKRKILCHLPFFKECFQYNISLWQCPSFLFFILGILNVGAMVATYFIATHFTDQPEITALITIVISLIILIIGSTIVHGFDRLLEVSKTKTEFIRIASHQLRTPLSALRWATDFLMTGGAGRPSAEQVEYLQIIKESNQRMLKLVNDLLDVTKIEMGNLTIIFEPVDLKQIAQEVINELSLLARANNISLKLEAADNLPRALSEREKIKMVFLNLIDNAIKYSQGKGQVTIDIKKAEEYLEVFIKDDGVGIPQAQQKNIFQKFFRSDNILKHQTVGSGLGLFIVKAIIDASRGAVWFESEEKKGTTFHLKIPIAK